MSHSQLPCFPWSKTLHSCAAALIATVFMSVALVQAQDRVPSERKEHDDDEPCADAACGPGTGRVAALA